MKNILCVSVFLYVINKVLNGLDKNLPKDINKTKMLCSIPFVAVLWSWNKASHQTQYK